MLAMESHQIPLVAGLAMLIVAIVWAAAKRSES